MSDNATAPAPAQPTIPEFGDWFVLHTRSRQEKRLATELSAMGIGVFLPLVRQTRFYGRRKATIEAPMFSSYVFLRGSREEAFEADRTRRVANILPVADQELIDWELRNIYFALQQEAPLEPYPHLTEGVAVEVRSGPFRGLQGVVEQRSRADRLMLQVDMLGKGMSLEIDASLLEPIDPNE